MDTRTFVLKTSVGVGSSGFLSAALNKEKNYKSRGQRGGSLIDEGER